MCSGIVQTYSVQVIRGTDRIHLAFPGCLLVVRALRLRPLRLGAMGHGGSSRVCAGGAPGGGSVPRAVEDQVFNTVAGAT